MEAYYIDEQVSELYQQLQYQYPSSGEVLTKTIFPLSPNASSPSYHQQFIQLMEQKLEKASIPNYVSEFPSCPQFSEHLEGRLSERSDGIPSASPESTRCSVQRRETRRAMRPSLESTVSPVDSWSEWIHTTAAAFAQGVLPPHWSASHFCKVRAAYIDYLSGVC